MEIEKQREIQHRFHKHPLVLDEEESNHTENAYCYGCGEVALGPCFSCSECKYHLHQKCAEAPYEFRFDPLHRQHSSFFLRERPLIRTGVTVDQEKHVEEPDETMDSSICVIKKNEHAEATIVKHFHHVHNLVLEDEMEDNSGNCDGCMLSISTPFYYCSECNFYLHKTWAELPKAKHHWFHRYVATLQFDDFRKCNLCRRHCSGLFYESLSHGREFDFCLRCAKVPNVIKCEGHKHFLFFDHKCQKQCNGCGVGNRYGAFRCRKCSFALDFACLTLPHAFQHKCDPHLLQLTHVDENDDVEQHYCDICEEKRDPTHWYYHRSRCDSYAHPECVLGKFPFIKDGITWPYTRHPHGHNLTFVRNVDGYPECFHCHKLCEDQTLKCSKCIYFRHCKCLRFRRRMKTPVLSVEDIDFCLMD
ncbi:hypothetical protein PTKIN_Ptkin16aG0099400 [Pterospermum kingtungense]